MTVHPDFLSDYLSWNSIESIAKTRDLNKAQIRKGLTSLGVWVDTPTPTTANANKAEFLRVTGVELATLFEALSKGTSNKGQSALEWMGIRPLRSEDAGNNYSPTIIRMVARRSLELGLLDEASASRLTELLLSKKCFLEAIAVCRALKLDFGLALSLSFVSEEQSFFDVWSFASGRLRDQLRPMLEADSFFWAGFAEADSNCSGTASAKSVERVIHAAFMGVVRANYDQATVEALEALRRMLCCEQWLGYQVNCMCARSQKFYDQLHEIGLYNEDGNYLQADLSKITEANIELIEQSLKQWVFEDDIWSIEEREWFFEEIGVHTRTQYSLLLSICDRLPDGSAYPAEKFARMIILNRLGEFSLWESSEFPDSLLVYDRSIQMPVSNKKFIKISLHQSDRVVEIRQSAFDDGRLKKKNLPFAEKLQLLRPYLFASHDTRNTGLLTFHHQIPMIVSGVHNIQKSVEEFFQSVGTEYDDESYLEVYEDNLMVAGTEDYYDQVFEDALLDDMDESEFYFEGLDRRS